MAIIRFYGDLKQFGTKYKINASTGAEALRCLIIQLPGLRKKIMDGWYRVRIAKEDIRDENQLTSSMHMPIANNSTIHIVPQVEGAKNNGVFSVIAGAVLIVAGLVVSVVSKGALSPLGKGMISAGVGMMIGGIVMMLTRLPSTDPDEGKKNNNTSFSNLDNSNTQGSPVPILYGRMMVSPCTLSEGLQTY